MNSILTVDEVYALLDYSWWVDSTAPNSLITWQKADLYFNTEGGIVSHYGSLGACPQNADGTYDTTTRQYYVQDYLMYEAARALSNDQCTGNISNVQPSNYSAPYIYGK